MSLDIAIEKRLAELRDKAEAYAVAKANMDYISEYKKSKLAILMKVAEGEGFKTAAAQEREAFAHPSYIELLKGLKAATEQAEKLRWELRMAEMSIDVWRTRESTKRIEMKGYGA